MKVIETEIEGLEGVETDVGWLVCGGIAIALGIWSVLISSWSDLVLVMERFHFDTERLPCRNGTIYFR